MAATDAQPRGLESARQGRPDEALADLRASIAATPLVADFHSNLAAVLGELGRAEQAIASLQEAIRLRPDFAAAHDYSLMALTLSNLPAGDNTMTLSFDVVALNNWQGNSGGPSFKVTSDGTTLISTNFSNDSTNPGNPHQAFGSISTPNGDYPARTGAGTLYTDRDNDHSGSSGSSFSSLPDSTYHLSFTFAHTGSTDAIAFTAPGASGLNAIALDNVNVNVARPTVSIAATTATTADGSGSPAVFTVGAGVGRQHDVE